MTFFRVYQSIFDKIWKLYDSAWGSRICSSVNYFQTIPTIKSVKMSYESSHHLTQSHEKISVITFMTKIWLRCFNGDFSAVIVEFDCIFSP